MKFAAHVFSLALALLTLSACETVTETLIIDETGTGSLLIDWTISNEQLTDLRAPVSETVDRAILGLAVDDAYGTSGYVLSDRVAFNELRGDRTGFTITEPIRNYDDVRNFGREDLQSGRPPVLLWRDVSLIEASNGSMSLTASPSVPDRQRLLVWATDGKPWFDDSEPMVFIASFSPRGQINSHNADEVDGNTLRWRVDGATPRTFVVDWTPMAPETQSALPFVAGLLVVIALSAIGLYYFDKRNLDRRAERASGSEAPVPYA